MSDLKQEASVVEDQEQVQETTEVTPEVTQPETLESKELYNSLKDDFEEMKKSMSAWQEKEKSYKNMIKGLDRKVSELTSEKKKLEQKEMSTEEILAEKEKELSEQYQSLWRDQSVVQNFSFLEQEDRNIIKTYLYGNTYEEVAESEKALFDIFDRYNKVNIEKALQEKLSQGYKPKGAGIQGEKGNTLADMDKKELAQKAIEIGKMPSGEEKDRLLAQLGAEQHRRITEGG